MCGIDITIVNVLQKSHIKDQGLPPVPDATNLLTLEDSSYHDVTSQGETSSDGYTLLAKEGDEPNDTGYDEVNEQDVASCHYEMSRDFVEGSGRKAVDDDHDYEEPYWEPASKEEELMDQLAKLSVPVITAKSIE